MSDETTTVEDVPTLQGKLPTAAPEMTLPEADVPQPPRPLVAGAFLGGEYEVKELLSRGLVNFYLALGGDYSQPQPFLVAEREYPADSVPAPIETEATETPAEVNAMEETEAAIVATLGESDSNQAEHEIPPAAALPRAELSSVLFKQGVNFIQDGREYLILPYEDSYTLQDWREPTNDARYARSALTLFEGLRELEGKGLTAQLTRDTLRFDDDGELRFYGFVDRADGTIHPESQVPLLTQLRETNAFLLKHVFAESATMRLDDEWSGLAIAEETRSFARHLADESNTSLEELAGRVPPLFTGALRVESAVLTDVGQEREVNEDSAMITRIARVGHRQSFEIELYAVADGMGGHEGGEVASDLTLNALYDAIAARTDLNWRDNVAVRAALWQVIEEVNSAVIALTDEPPYRSMRHKPGATLVFALRCGPTLFIGNVGDSRAYLWNAVGGLQRATIDHSYVQTLIDSGQLQPDKAWGHPDGSIITAHIGMTKLKQRDVFLRMVAPGDKLILVSDGVVDMLRDEEIEPHLHHDDPHEVCRRLVEASNRAGGHDNISVVCVGFG